MVWLGPSRRKPIISHDVHLLNPKVASSVEAPTIRPCLELVLNRQTKGLGLVGQPVRQLHQNLWQATLWTSFRRVFSRVHHGSAKGQGLIIKLLFETATSLDCSKVFGKLNMEYIPPMASPLADGSRSREPPQKHSMRAGQCEENQR